MHIQRVEEGAQVVMTKQQQANEEATAERHSTVATTTVAVDASTRAREDRLKREDERGRAGRGGMRSAAQTDFSTNLPFSPL